MKAVNVDDVLKILYKYGRYIFVTDEKRYTYMIDEIANIKALEPDPILDKIKTEMEQNAYPILSGMNKIEHGMTLYEILQIINKYKKRK